MKKLLTRISIIFLMLCNAFSPIQFGFSQTKTVHMVSTAHLDTQWNWTVKSTINSFIPKTLNENFALFEKYPNYKFNWEGAIHYMWAKEYYPAEYARLKTYVAQGRWNVAGNALDANDVNVPSVESNFRNILYGRNFFKSEFGKTSTDLFLPDCFGFSYTLPTIAKHCGLKGFSTQKLSWGSAIPRPFDIGIWQGVDGSKIMAALDPGAYDTQVREDLSRNNNLLNIVNNLGSQTGHYTAYRYYGTGDTGGSPGEESVSWMEKSVNGTGPLKIIYATADQLYNGFSESQYNNFKTHNGELIMKWHGNACYTSYTENKKWNRKNELLGDAAERSAVMADWIGGLSYPSTQLYEAWKRVIWHQFHDDLPGTSIPEAYNFTSNDHLLSQKDFASTLTNASGAVARVLDTRAQGKSVVVYNPLSIPREDIVEANLSFPSRPAYIRVYDKAGTEVPAQILSYEGGILKFIFAATVSSLSYEVYDARASADPSGFISSLKVSNNHIENSIYKVVIDGNGDVSSIVDKRIGKELLSSPVRLGMLNNISSFWPSWEITPETVKATPQAYVGSPTLSIAENGLLRGAIKITRQSNGSTFVQYLRLTSWGPKERVDFATEVDWYTKSTLLKAIFPLAVSNSKATYDLGLGVIQRNNNTDNQYEVPAQQWADITDPSNAYGVSILNDCKYGWDKPANNTLRLSLIHTPGVTDRFVYQGKQDFGKQSFVYAIYGHSGKYSDANTVWEAEKLNQPLIAFESPKHEGSLGKSLSLASVNTNQVAIKAFKKAENGSEYVFRVYETKGQNANNVKITFCAPITAANELNGVEETIGGASFTGNTLTLNMTPFQPKTFSVKLASPSFKIANPESKPVALPYDDDAISPDSDRGDGNFDGKKISFSAELLPETVMADGIAFKIGPKDRGAKNIIRCNGNTIPLPEASKYKKVYILAASSVNGEENQDQKGTFKIGDKSYELAVPYFSKFIGQGGGEYSTPYFKESNIAWTGTHRHNGAKNEDERYEFTYLFKYSILIPTGATELTLPVNKNIAIFSVTLANNDNDNIINATPLIEKPFIYPMGGCSTNYAKNKSVTAPGACNSNESAANAVDGDADTKWCYTSSQEKWLEIDLGEDIEICSWIVINAGVESADWITKEYALQVKSGNNWVTVDQVKANQENVTNRIVNNISGRYVRLLLPYSSGNEVARIYEFKVNGMAKSSCNQNRASSGIATASGSCNSQTETADKAIDNDYSTKWCDLTPGEKWLEIDLKDNVDICRWTVVHAGLEDKTFITRDFALQVKSGTSWITVDQVTNNISNNTDRTIPKVNARVVRLLISGQSGYPTARIYDFKVYGAATAPSTIGTVYKDCNYNSTGYAVGLDAGTYTLAQLNAKGILNNDISSLKIQSGYEMVLYADDNFSGTSLVARADNICLGNNNFNDIASSLIIRSIPANQNSRLATSSLAEADEIKVTPNPATDYIRIRSSGHTKVSIYNLQGYTMISEAVLGPEGTLSIRHLPAGVYTVQLQTGSTIKHVMIVKL